MAKSVELLIRATCGSCARVKKQITPVVEAAGLTLQVVDVDEDEALKLEFGDRTPVVLVDGEEFACWEVDNDELVAALA